MSGDDDSTLMLAVGRGDRRAFATLFDRHQASVVRFCGRFVGNAARGEELAQDVFVRLYQSAKRYQPSARFKTYLFRVATNACLNELRRPALAAEQAEASLMSHDDETGERTPLGQASGGETPDLAVEGKELEAAVDHALRKMSERERAAFTMCRFEGMAYRDIADALEASEAAVKSLIHRATLQVVAQVDALAAAAQPSLAGVAHG